MVNSMEVALLVATTFILSGAKLTDFCKDPTKGSDAKPLKLVDGRETFSFNMEDGSCHRHTLTLENPKTIQIVKGGKPEFTCGKSGIRFVITESFETKVLPETSSFTWTAINNLGVIETECTNDEKTKLTVYAENITDDLMVKAKQLFALDLGAMNDSCAKV